MKKLWDDESSVPYVVSFAVTQAWSVPPDFAVEQYRGLLNLYLFKDTSAGVVCYWKDQSFYFAARAEFARRMQLPGGAAPEAGWLADFHARKQKWWHFASSRELVLALGSLTAAALGIRDFGAQAYNAIAATPQLEVSTSTPDPVKVVEQDQIVVPLAILNSSRAAAEATCEGCELQRTNGKTGPVPLSVASGQIPRVDENKTIEVRLLAAGQKVDKNSLSYDEYEVHGKILAKAGFFGGQPKYVIPASKVQVWPVLANTAPKFTSVSGNFAVFTAQVFAGRRKQMAVFTLEMDGASGVTPFGVKDYQPHTLCSDDGSTCTMQWTVSPIEPFRQDAVFESTFRSKTPKSEAEWKKYEGHLILTVE